MIGWYSINKIGTKMTRVIEVAGCWQCPFCDIYDAIDEGRNLVGCRKTNKTEVINNVNFAPWCPLSEITTVKRRLLSLAK